MEMMHFFQFSCNFFHVFQLFCQMPKCNFSITPKELLSCLTFSRNLVCNKWSNKEFLWRISLTVVVWHVLLSTRFITYRLFFMIIHFGSCTSTVAITVQFKFHVKIKPDSQVYLYNRPCWFDYMDDLKTSKLIWAWE